MVRRQEPVEVPLRVETKDAKEDLKEFGGFFEASIVKISDSVQRSMILAPLAGGLANVYRSIGGGIADPTQSLSAQSGGIASSATTGIGAGAGFAVGGVPGAVAGGFLGDSLGKLFHRYFAKSDFVEAASGAQVKGIESRFAQVGLKSSDQEISKLLNLFRNINGRIFDSMKQVAEVQEKTSNTMGGMIGKGVRRSLDWVK